MYRESGTQDSGVLCIRAVFFCFVCVLLFTVYHFSVLTLSWKGNGEMFRRVDRALRRVG